MNTIKQQIRTALLTSLNELTNCLRDQAPKRGLADDQRQLIDALVANGMKRDSARKLELRTRRLPEQQRQERLLRTRNKLNRSARTPARDMAH